MTTYNLEIIGNGNGKNGNPIPYTRVLSNKIRADGARYLEWQQFVRAQFSTKYPKTIWIDGKKWGAPIRSGNHPVKAKCWITFKDKSHGDADNIFKGLLDALLFQDKYVMEFHVYAEYGPVGKVYIEVEVCDDIIN